MIKRRKKWPFTVVLVTLSTSLITPTAVASPVFKPQKDCFQTVMDFINKKPGTLGLKTRYEAAAKYNDQIFFKVSDLNATEWSQSVDHAIDQFAIYDNALDADAFKKFIHENPGSPAKDEQLGKYLNERFQAFKQGAPTANLDQAAAELPDELRKIAKDCGKNKSCHEQKVGGWVSKKLSGTCLGKNKEEAVRSMVTGLALTSAGLFASYAKNPDGGYPFDMLASTLFWTPIMSELGCRNTLAKGEIGNKVDFGQISRKEKIKTGLNNYIEYMVLSPLTNVTYAGFHTIQQVARGEKEWKDVNLKEMGIQIAALSTWDAIYPVPRMVLITDPLFMKGFPQLRKSYLRKIPNKAVAEGAYLTTDFGTRIGLNFLNTEMFNWWLKQSDQMWDTHFNTVGSQTSKHLPKEAKKNPEINKTAPAKPVYNPNN
jgi:hypothetical protein